MDGWKGGINNKDALFKVTETLQVFFTYFHNVGGFL